MAYIPGYNPSKREKKKDPKDMLLSASAGATEEARKAPRLNHREAAKKEMEGLLQDEKLSSAAGSNGVRREQLIGEDGNQIRYSVPGQEGEIETGNLSPEKAGELMQREEGTLSDLRRPTKSGGDFYGGVDVTQMTPKEYLRFKVNSMNRSAEMFRQNRLLKSELNGDARARRVHDINVNSPTLSGGMAPKREKLLAQYAREKGKILDDIQAGRLTKGGASNALKGLKDYYSTALGESPSDREAAETERAQIRAGTQLEAQRIASSSALERARLQEKGKDQVNKLAPSYEMKLVPDLDVPLRAMFDKKSGTVKYPTQVQAALSEFRAALSKGKIGREEAKQLFQSRMPENLKDLDPEML